MMRRLAPFVFLFTAQLIVGRCAIADGRADALIARAKQILSKSHAATFDRSVSISMEGKSAGKSVEQFRLLKPGYWSMARTGSDAQRRLSDGKYAYSRWDKNKQYIKAAALKPEILFQDFGPVAGAFFGTSVILPNQSGKYLGAETVDGKRFEVIQVLGEAPGGIPAEQKLYFGASGLPEIRQYRSEIEKGKALVMQERVDHIVLNAKLKADDFRFTLPAGFSILDAATPPAPAPKPAP